MYQKLISRESKQTAKHRFHVVEGDNNNSSGREQGSLDDHSTALEAFLAMPMACPNLVKLSTSQEETDGAPYTEDRVDDATKLSPEIQWTKAGGTHVRG